MKRILFVDDEPRVLQGLERLLFEYTEDWAMEFVTSGDAALRELDRQNFDVLITDMRMPGMDGAALLRHVQKRHPKLVRIVLSGHTELEAALRALPIAHQFLCKPCDAETLMRNLQRACSLQELISDEVVRGLVGAITELPVRPQVYSTLVSAIADDNTTTRALADIVAQDAAISSKLLHIVNSALFSPRRPIATMHEAVARIGTRVLRDLVLSIEVFQDSGPAPAGFSFDTLSQHGMKCGSLARKLVAPEHADDAFLAGMLHELGILVLATRMPAYFRELLQLAHERRVPMVTLELELKGITHAELGAYLLGLWGMPYPVVDAVAHHHNPERLKGRGMDASTALHLAELLVSEARPDVPAWTAGTLSPEYLLDLGVTADLGALRALVNILPK